jgi:hypothetical protein
MSTSSDFFLHVLAMIMLVEVICCLAFCAESWVIFYAINLVLFFVRTELLLQVLSPLQTIN